MQSLEAACDEGERAVKGSKAFQAASLPPLSIKEEIHSSSHHYEPSKKFDLFAELQKLLDEDETDSDEEARVKHKSLILDRLVRRERLNTLIFNFYPRNRGYSVTFRLRDRRMCFKEKEEIVETKTWGYEEDAMLGFLEQEVIPPYIIDALDRFDFLFYSGCVIAEVRNYRQANTRMKCQIYHVLLRPAQQTLLADVRNLTQYRPDFTREDKDIVESQIIMADTPELCLDPDPHIEHEMSEYQNRSRLWQAYPFDKIRQKATQIASNRKRKLDSFSQRHGLRLLEYVKAKRAKMERDAANPACSRQRVIPIYDENKTVIPIPHLEPEPDFRLPSSLPVINKFKPPGTWPEESKDFGPHLLEEYTLETDITSKDMGRPRVYHIKLSIFQRPANLEFVGELYLDRDYKAGQRNGVACRFPLGNRIYAHRYIRQFTEIFTECGRKSVRISCGIAKPNPSPTATAQSTLSALQPPNPREQVERLAQILQAQNQQHQPVVNGIAQGVQIQHAQATAPIAQKSTAMSSQEKEIDALANKLKLSWEAAEKAKRLQAAAQQQQTVTQQRLMARKMMLSNVPGARILNQGNLITVNNLQELNAQLVNATPAQTVTLSAATVNNATRVNLSDLTAQLSSGQGQTVTLTSVNSGGGSFTYTMPVKQQVVHHQRIALSPHQQDTNKEGALGALLVGTPAANRPESPNQASSILFESLAASSGSGGQNLFAQAPKTPQPSAQFVVQSPKANSVSVISPMSSPPPQATNTLNVQGLNLSQLQSISGLHNVQFQLPNFSQPISLALNVGGQITGGTASQGLLMSLPGTPAQQATVATQGASQTVQGVVMNAAGGSAGPSQLAHLVTAGTMKNITHHNIRSASGSQTLQLTPGSSQFQVISQLQRPNRQQNIQTQANRTLQRTQTIKMAPNTNQTLETIQHYPQMCISQSKGLEGVFDKLRRSNE